MNNRLFAIALLWWIGSLLLFGADHRPLVHLAVTRMADEDTKEGAWIAMSRKPPLADEMPNCWYWYPPGGKPFFAIVTPVTVSDFAVFGVRFFWDISQANAFPANLQYVEAKWDTPTPFTFEGRQFVLFASLKSLDYVKGKTYPKRTPSPPR